MKQEKRFLFHFESSFRSSDDQISTFQVFKCHDGIKCPIMKHETHNEIWPVYVIFQKKIFLSKIYLKSMAWKLYPDPF